MSDVRTGRVSEPPARACGPHLVRASRVESLSVSSEPGLGPPLGKTKPTSRTGAAQRCPCTRAPLTARRRPYNARVPLIDDIAGLRRILKRSHTLAVVGLSANWYRPSYFAAKYMLDHGYRVIPVNPTYREVLGQRCYPDLASVPELVAIVDCFRKPGEMPGLA